MTAFFEALTNAELYVLDFIQNISNPVFDVIMPFVSMLCAHGEIWIALAVVLLCFTKTRKTGMTMAFALIFGLVCCNLTLKPVVARIRPYEYRQIMLIVPKLDDFSFPSGHTIASFEAVGAMFFTKCKGKAFVLALAVVIAFSRLYLYVHFPTDVIVSVILGLLFAWLASKLSDYIISKAPKIINSKK